MGVSRYIKPFETLKRLTHNQGVPGSSPGGTTSSRKPIPKGVGFFNLEISKWHLTILRN